MKTYSSCMPFKSTRQRGMTLIGLIFWVVVIGFSTLVFIRTLPAINEYRTLLSMADRLSKEGGSTPLEIRAAFDNLKKIEYGVESISSSDLNISKDNEKIVIAFAYDKQIPLVGPVFLLIKFEGQSR